MSGTRTAFFALIFSLIFVLVLPAQESALSFSGSDPEVNFGKPSSLGSDSHLQSYLRTDATLSITGSSVIAAGHGVTLFIQKEGRLAGGFPSALPNFTALAHGNGFVSIYSAKHFLPEPALETEVARGARVGKIGNPDEDFDPDYRLRVYDGSSRLWVNPVLFIQGFQDRAAPKIEEITLLGEGRAYTAENRKNFTQTIRQGEYALAVRVMDPSYARGSVSGTYGFKALLDGKVFVDRKFDSARITEKGLAFLGLGAPSSSIVDNGGRIILDGQFIPNGLHSLEFSVYDYAGNTSNFTWKFKVE